MGDPSSSQIPTPKHHQGIPRSASHPRVGKEHKSHKKWHHLRYLSRKEGIKEKLRSNNQCFKPGESFSSYDGGFIISNPTLISTTINRIKLPSPTPSPTPTPTPAPTPAPAPPATPTPAEPSPEPAPAPAPAPTAAPTPTLTPTRFQKLRSQRSKTPTPTTFTEQERQENRRNPTQRSVTPTPKSTDLLASLRENLSEDIAATSTSKRIPPMGAHRDATPLWSRMASKQYAAPIIYSHSTSTVRRKPPPIEKSLACTLEELCFGGVKKIKITRDVLSNLGVMVQEEILTINIKPGWKKGTKITFEGKGDERPGTLPADITFIIDEKRHHLFKRLGNDLMLGVEIPLVQALTGCTITVPLLGEGKEMELSFDNTILYPGYEKIIPDQGMPKPKGNGSRGDLRLQFLVEFPEELSDEQRSEFVSILEDCS